jgi:hypothetical protein
VVTVLACLFAGLVVKILVFSLNVPQRFFFLQLILARRYAQAVAWVSIGVAGWSLLAFVGLAVIEYFVRK